MNRILITLGLTLLANINLSAQCVADAGLDSVYCGDFADTLTIGGTPTATGGFPPYTYQWSTLDGYNKSILFDVLNDTTIANPQALTQKTVKLLLMVTDSRNNHCYDSVQIVNSTWSRDLMYRLRIIKMGDSVRLNSGVYLSSIGHPPYRFLWSPSEGLSDPTVLNTYASPQDSITYNLTITDVYGCTYPDHFTIWVESETSNIDDIKVKNADLIYRNESKSLLVNVERNSIPAKLWIFNMSGELVTNTVITSHNQTIDLSHTIPGLYSIYLTRESGELLVVKRIVKR